MAAALLALPSMAPLFGPGLIGTHRYGDSPFLLVRLVSLTEGLRRGEVVPRWSPELSYGLGYPFWDFYAPLAYYLAAVPYLLGVTAVASLKLVQALGFVGASLATFALARRHLGELGGLVVAAAYGYAPYHLVNVYARGDSLGEFTAMAVLPGLLLVVELACRGRGIAGLGVALLFAALVLSHNLSALLAAPIVGLWVLLCWQGVRGFLLAAGGVGLGAALTTYYWLPVLVDRRYITFEHNLTGYFDFRAHFVGIGRLVQPWVVYDYGLNGTADGGLPFQVGLVQAAVAGGGLGVAAVGWWAAAAGRRRDVQQVGDGRLAGGLLAAAVGAGSGWWGRCGHGPRAASGADASGGGAREGGGWRLSVLGGAVAVGALTLATPLGRPVWELLPPLQVAQFPWRLLGPAALGLALVAGAPALVLRGRRQAVWAVCAVFLVVAGGAWGVVPERWRIPDGEVDVARVQQYEYLTSSIGSTVRYEYLPREARERPWTSSYLLMPGVGPRALPGQGSTVTATGERAFRAVGAGGSLVLEQHYFPGWRSRVDGTEVPVGASEPEGYLVVDVPAGEHAVELEFRETRARWIGRWMSTVAGLVFVGGAGVVGLGAWRRIARGKARRGGNGGVGSVVQIAAAGTDGCPPNDPRAAGARGGAAVAVVSRDGGGVAMGLAAGALLLFVLQAPWGEWLVKVPGDGFDRRFTHEHAPWPYVEPTGVPLGGARLTGYRQPEAVAAGETLRLELRAEGSERVEARLVHPAEAILQVPRGVSAAEVALGGESELNLPVPIGTAPGLYRVELAAGSGRRWSLVPVRVERGAAAAPATLLANFGGVLGLEGIAMAPDATAARPAVQLRWRALAAGGERRGDWRVSARLVDDEGRLWGSSDGRPADGFYPTGLWQPGELVVERRDLLARLGTPPGHYRLEVRVYQHGGRTLDVLDQRGAAVAPAYRSEPVVLARPAVPARPAGGTGGIGLLEGKLGASEVVAGTTVPLELLWRVDAAPGRDVELAVRIGASEVRMSPATGFPAREWRAGDLVAAQPSPRVPLELRDGEHAVTVALVDADGRPALPATEIGRLRVVNRPRRFDVPAIQRSVGARFGEAIELLGFDLAPSGDRARLTLYWRAAGSIDRSWTVFTHLLDSAGRVRGQVDAVPGGGALPTDGWARGEVVVDRYEIPLAGDAPAGQYAVEIGLYDARGGERLPVRAMGSAAGGGPDHLILGRIDLTR